MSTATLPLNAMQLALLNSGLVGKFKKTSDKPKKFRKMQHKSKIVGYRFDVVTGERVMIVSRTMNA